MFNTLVILLIALWFLALISSHTLGGLIHLLPIIAMIMILRRVVAGWRLQWPFRRKE